MFPVFFLCSLDTFVLQGYLFRFPCVAEVFCIISYKCFTKCVFQGYCVEFRVSSSVFWMLHVLRDHVFIFSCVADFILVLFDTSVSPHACCLPVACMLLL